MKISPDKKRLESDKIVILIRPWKPIMTTISFFKKVIPNNAGYLYYKIPGEMLNSDPYLTKKRFNIFINSIVSEMERLNKIKKRKYYFYGQSLGCLFGMIISDKVYIKKARLVVPGDNLAESFWSGLYTRILKRKMTEKNITLPQLKEIWKDISPDFYFKDKSKNCFFDIILSRRDNIIPIKGGLNLIKIMEKKNIPHRYKISSFPHLGLMIFDSLFPWKKIKKLLRDDNF